MATPKPYTSEKWLRLQYVQNKVSIDDIAKMCNVSHNTIRTQLIKFKLIRK